MAAFDQRIIQEINERLKDGSLDDEVCLFEQATQGGYTDFNLLVDLLRRLRIKWCLIGGVAVNSYVEPVYTADIDLVVISANLTQVCQALKTSGLGIKRKAHWIDARRPGTKGGTKGLLIQLSTDITYQDFLSRSRIREVFGKRVPVARLPDLVRSKMDAWRSPTRKPWKRSKDESDLLRLGGKYPEIVSLLPREIQRKL